MNLDLYKRRVTGIYDDNKEPSGDYYEGTEGLSDRLNQAGGYAQHDRMVLDKYRSFNKALYYSYQRAFVKKVSSAEEEIQPVRALINPDKLKRDYDDKIISVDYKYGFKVGDVFEWVDTNTHWLIYLQEIEEYAYFKGEIRKCSYELGWEDEEGNSHSTFAAVRGPVETKINFIQKHGISVDRPNYSLELLIPKTPETMDEFQRYTKFYLQGDDTCWRVEAVDKYSSEGIIEVTAVEYYANQMEDDIENGIAGGLIVKPVNPNPPEVEDQVVGETFIKPKREYTYKYVGNSTPSWKWDAELPIEYEEIDSNTIKIKWTAAYSAQFDLYATQELKKTIVVESLF